MSSPIVQSIREALHYLFTRQHVLEGRYDEATNTYANWDASVAVQPGKFLAPRNEDQLRGSVLKYDRIHVAGAGHSFNELHLRDGETLLSLDGYETIEPELVVDDETNRVTVTFNAGWRLRDVTRWLHDRGYALPVLPDHNAQSIAGVLATDVHASGVPAHVSEAVVSLGVMDAQGQVHYPKRGDDLFRATIGGAGCTGVIVEATFECVPEFQLETQSLSCSFDDFLAKLDHYIDNYDHMAVGFFPVLDTCIVELKDRTRQPLTRNGTTWETLRHVMEAILQAFFLPLTFSKWWLPRAIAAMVLRRTTGRLRRRKHLVLDSAEGYNRNVYHVQKQVEFVCPRERAIEVLKAGRDLLRTHPRQHYYLLGLRASRRHGETLIGGAAGAATSPEGEEDIVWIAPHLFGNKTDPEIERAWAKLVAQFQGLPHLGKNLLGLNTDYFAKVHGQRWDAYLRIVREYDPHGKFANDLIRPTPPLSWPPAPPEQEDTDPSFRPFPNNAGAEAEGVVR